jgi:ATP-dependent Lon protease
VDTNNNSDKNNIVSISSKSRKNSEYSGEQTLPVLPVGEILIFPGMVASLQFESEFNNTLIDQLDESEYVALLLRKSPLSDRIQIKDLYRTGILARLLNKIKIGEDVYQLYLQGLQRLSVETFISLNPIITAQVRVVSQAEIAEDSLKSLRQTVMDNLEEFVAMAPRISTEVIKLISLNADNNGKLADFIASYIPFDSKDRQKVMEASDVEHRLTIVNELLEREIGNIGVMNEISQMAREEIDVQQRKMFLRRQLKTIQRELGEDPELQRLEELRKRIQQSNMPADVVRRANKEINRLQSTSSASAEYTVILNYIDWLLDIPWNIETEDNLDLKQARAVLDEYHYGLDEVKERILEFLAVRYKKREVRGPVLCLSGPPGVGKTSLGKAIAKAMGRKFVRFSVGGLRDENEIRGHRRTYVGAMPGRIIQSLKQAESYNPVFMIDEIDKMGSDFRGDPSSAMLEILDPEQNDSFYDHYLDIPVDLSHVFFIVTANVIPNIPGPLQDRLEIIRLSGYTEQEKVQIAGNHLLPRQVVANGLALPDLVMDEKGLLSVVRGYTREAGVRNLERQLANVCRKITRKVVEGEKGPFKISGKNLNEILGEPQFRQEVKAVDDSVGITTAMAWSEFGGEILFVESRKTPGNGQIRVTGQIGDVMRESAEAAVTWVKSCAKKYNIDPELFSKVNIHIHIPAGAIPKDGPSAGLAIASAVTSLMAEVPAKHTVAMTGEISLSGRVLPIGGVREKCLAAHRAGIKTILLPEENRKSIAKMPKTVLDDIEFIFVESIEQALPYILVESTETQAEG